MTSEFRSVQRRSSRFAVGSAARPWVAVAALVVAGGLALEGPEPLEARGGFSQDTDGDGLRDALEQVLGTSPYLYDSDGDTFGDLEEFARGSDASRAQSRPAPDAVLDVHESAYGQDGYLHIVVAYFRSSRSTKGFRLRLGVQQDGRVRALPVSYLAQRTCVMTEDVAGGEVTLMDMRVHPDVVRPNSASSWLVAVQDENGPDWMAAASIDIHRLGTVHCLVLPQTDGDEGTASAVGGSVYLPIPPGGSGDIPSDWTAGQICVRMASTVGADGAVLTKEVTDANCENGWDGYCGSECGASVGNTYTSVDPAILVGG